MGVIKKILYRGNILAKPRHRNLFLDMEENIHIHYRDLRIELSRGEFEDIAGVFSRQSKELLTVIQKKNYQDGKLPNANQDDVRIWTESRLKHDVKYHPQRFSLEECGDGYHFHYRNYKLLIDPVEFRQLVQLFKGLDLDAPYAASYDEVIDLLEANEVDFTLDGGNVPGEVLAISVAQYHLPKVRDIFEYIGFAQEIDAAGRRYIGNKLKVIVFPDKSRSALDYRAIRAYNETGRLVDFLSRNAAVLDPNLLNRIKCQVIDLYHAMLSDGGVTVDADPQSWLYSKANEHVVFPYSSSVRVGKKDAEAMYRSWSAMLAKLELGFVKPAKEAFSAEAQAALQQRVYEALRREVAAYRAVSRLYLMGSAKRGDMGRYQAPFVHGKMVKLGSDVDILVEMEASHEADIPGTWQLFNPEASNHCAVYHVAEIPLAGGLGDWASRHPHIPFTQHLIDAYVFFPSHGHEDAKDAFLKKFGAKLVYDRTTDGIVYRSDEEQRIAARLAEIHGFGPVAVERMKVSTENALYKVFLDHRDLILKLFKVSGNYQRTRVAEHTDYEERLIGELRARGIHTPAVIQAERNRDTTIEGFPALLFERLQGIVQQRPEYDLGSICGALAAIHHAQMEGPLNVPQAFTFDEYCMLWLPVFQSYLHNPAHGPEVAQAFASLAPVAERCNPGDNRALWYAHSPAVHCHGDVTPKNVIVGADAQASFFDFNNAFYGPRLADVVDGAIEFSLAEKYIHLADFGRFDAFVESYSKHNPLTAEEKEDLPHWIELLGLIKFTKEIRVLLERPKDDLRRKRALAIAAFVTSRCGAA